MGRPYQKPGLVLRQQGQASAEDVRALQTDLRALGYLKAGIDGDFGGGTAGAVRALSYDLLNNTGASSQGDGPASVRMVDYNRQRVPAKTAEVDQAFASCIADLMADSAVPKLPRSDDAAADNRRIVASMLANPSKVAPTPFLMAMMLQESSGSHFQVPSGSSTDSFITVGLDRNDASDRDHITSRGYGAGQATLFHHPPREEEIQRVMIDPLGNLQGAYAELRDKLDHFVVGQTSGTRADDRTAEHPLLPLRLCRYAPTDPKYMRDCQRCAAEARSVTIDRGTPLYAGASESYQPDGVYRSVLYPNVPDRADFRCDWPYAARRYNGSGVHSFVYQTIVLRNLLAQPAAIWS
jgi:hypothetical protein